MRSFVPLLVFGLIGLARIASADQPMLYNGYLQDGVSPVNGSTNFTWRVYDAPSGGTLLLGPQTVATTVTNGSFAFVLTAPSGFWTNGTAKWLSIGINDVVNESVQRVLIAPVSPVAQAQLANTLAGSLITQPTTSLPVVVGNDQWAVIDSVTINPGSSGIIAVTAEGTATWGGILSSSTIDLAISQTTPLVSQTSIASFTAHATQSWSVSMPPTPTTGSQVFYLWAKIPIGNFYQVDATLKTWFVPVAFN